MSIVPTLFLGVEYCATFQAALYIETHSLMHQIEFHAASVALSRATDKRKSLINIHKNGYTATLMLLMFTGSLRYMLPNLVSQVIFVLSFWAISQASPLSLQQL